MADHPGVIFKDGPSGRRAALAYGPDVWEIIKFLREIDERGPAALDAAAESFAVDPGRIATSVSYYGDYADEVDAEIVFSPVTAAALRDLGHDVACVAEQPGLRAMIDEDVFALAAAQGRWLLTENVKDFQPILQQSLQAGLPAFGLLFTSSRAFPRSHKNPGPLIQAMDAWLCAGPPEPPITEDWLFSSGP